MNSIQLPIDIIDNIITVNPYTILSLYNKLSKNLKSTRNTRNKRQKLDKNVLLEHIINNKSNYFSKTIYFKYFSNKTEKSDRISIGNCNDISKIIDNVINNYVILSKYIKKIDILDKNKNKNKDKILFNLETYISNNISENLLNEYMNIIKTVYNITNFSEIPSFINLYIILKSCNYFPINKECFTYNNIISYLDAILKSNSKSDNSNNSDIYFITLIHSINYMCTPEYKYIPLFRLSLGMGFNFIIGYDILIDRVIGFLSGGSSSIEYEYSEVMIRKYLSLNKLQRIQQYERKIGKINNNNIYKTITKYLDLFFLDLANLPNPFDFLDEHKLNILDN
jgi:hypothetical protein